MWLDVIRFYVANINASKPANLTTGKACVKTIANNCLIGWYSLLKKLRFQNLFSHEHICCNFSVSFTLNSN